MPHFQVPLSGYTGLTLIWDCVEYLMSYKMAAILNVVDHH